MTLIVIHKNEWTFRFYGRLITVQADTYCEAVSAVLDEIRG